MKSRVLLAGLGLALLLYLLPATRGAAPVVRSRLAMGTVVTVKLYLEEGRAARLAEAALAEIDRIDSLMGHYSPDSEVSLINRRAAEEAVRCSPEMAVVLERSQHFAQRSGGVFDITLGSLTRLWGFPDARRPPPATRVDSALALAGWEGLQLHDRDARLLRRGARLDLGGVAKGYAVDRAVDALQDSGVACGLITAGGSIRFWGAKPDGRPWRLGVQHPRDPKQLVEVEDLGLAALATSGDYQQYFEWEGERFHHLLDPATGYPARRAVSATVWTDTAVDADILSTAVFVMGPDRGLEWIETVPQTEVLVFFEEGGRLAYRASGRVANRLDVPVAGDADTLF